MACQEWEKLSIFLNFLIPKLPAPKEEDLAKGILEAIDMDSYRAEKKATMAIALPDADAEIEPVPTSGGGRKPEPEMDKLSNIMKQFNDQFGGLFADPKRMEKRITEEIPPKVAADGTYQNAKKNSDRQNARIEHDKALKRVITGALQRRRPALQAVPGQRVFPTLAHGHGVWDDLRAVSPACRLAITGRFNRLSHPLSASVRRPAEHGSDWRDWLVPALADGRSHHGCYVHNA